MIMGSALLGDVTLLLDFFTRTKAWWKNVLERHGAFLPRRCAVSINTSSLLKKLPISLCLNDEPSKPHRNLLGSKQKEIKKHNFERLKMDAALVGKVKFFVARC
jgi:hypothetical protein